MTTAEFTCLSCNVLKFGRCLVTRDRLKESEDLYTYCECPDCGSLTLATPPDLSQSLYADDYYSFSLAISVENSEFRRAMRRHVSNHILGHRNLLGFAWSHWKSQPAWLSWLKKCRITTASAILDVGCGNGALPWALYRAGFDNVVGIDPFLPGNEVNRPGLSILRSDPATLNRTFDLIMLNHVLEHVPNPKDMLSRLYDLCALSGSLLIRVPLADSLAYRRYGINWFQLDAPRHTCLFTSSGLVSLASSLGFVLKEHWRDSVAYQFLASDLLECGLSRSQFPKDYGRAIEDIQKYEQLSQLLNELYLGDQGGFVFARTQ